MFTRLEPTTQFHLMLQLLCTVTIKIIDEIEENVEKQCRTNEDYVSNNKKRNKQDFSN